MLNVVSSEKAREIITDNFSSFTADSELVDLCSCLGRVTACDITAEENIPCFNRSTVDGYAVVCRDTFGSGESMPAILTVKGEIFMGEKAETCITDGECIRVSTGGMLPEGADAVVMVENTQQLDDETCLIFKAVSPFENVTRLGDDVSAGHTVIKKGTRLTSRHVGILAALGKTKILCVKKLRVAIISTGDEVVPIESNAQIGQVRDINSHILSALMEEKGCIVERFGIVKDDFDSIYNCCKTAAESCDVILISGGSSAGARDMTVKVISSLGEVFLHGIAMKPGKPTIIGRIGKKAVFGLPGHPTAAYFVAMLFVGHLINTVCGITDTSVKVKARLSTSISSNHGREEIVPVMLCDDVAVPIFRKSGVVSLLSSAHGFVVVDRNKEGLKENEEVDVCLF